MQKCRFTITTVADGNENSVTGDGELELSATGASLSYLDGDTRTSIVLYKGEGTLSREGAYSLHLSLKENEVRMGKIGIAGTVGDVSVKTHFVRYSVQEDSLLASIQYDLQFGADTQKMKLRIYAKIFKTEGKE